MVYSDSDRFKWQVLDEAPHLNDLGVAYYWAKRFSPDADSEQQRELVERVILDLVDAGLIFCYYASRDDGYRIPPRDFEPVDRAVVERELSLSADYADPEDDIFWYAPTAEGLAVLDALPPEAFLKPHPERVRRFEEHRQGPE